MKYCMPHWNQLRAAVESRGMGHLVLSPNIEPCHRCGEAEEIERYDPLEHDDPHGGISRIAYLECGNPDCRFRLETRYDEDGRGLAPIIEAWNWLSEHSQARVAYPRRMAMPAAAPQKEG